MKLDASRVQARVAYCAALIVTDDSGFWSIARLARAFGDNYRSSAFIGGFTEMHIQNIIGSLIFLLLSLGSVGSLAQGQDSPGTEDHPLVSRYTGAFIDGQEVLNFAEALAKGIDARGHIAVYGVYFDTNSAEIKAESAPAMQ